MYVVCGSCRKRFSLDEATLPDKPVLLKCPSCGTQIKVAKALAEHKPKEPDKSRQPPKNDLAENIDENGIQLPAHGSPQWLRLKQEITAEVLKNLGVKVHSEANGENGQDEYGAGRALVCDDEGFFQDTISEAIGKLGYKVDVAPDMAKALAALRKNRYELVTVDHAFPENPEGGYEILQEISALPPEIRRRMFVAYVSADLSTMDTNSAFILGANLTVSKKDVKTLDKILEQGIKNHTKLYSVFSRVVDELQNEGI